METKELKKLMEILRQSGVNEFEMEREDVKIKVTRGAITNVAPMPATTSPIAAQISPAAPASSGTVEAESTQQKEAESAEDFENMEGIHIITSPIVGTFYRCPNPTADPYVEIGDKVKQGQSLCIVEAMKLMNEITSDVSGEVVKIFTENAHAVEYGEPLFAIKTM